MAVLSGVLHTTANKGVGPSAGGTFPIAAQLMTIGSAGTAESISVRIWYNNGGYKFAIYSSDKSTLLGETANIATPATGTRTAAITVPFAVTLAQQVYVVVIVNNDNDSCTVQTNNDGTDVLETGSVASYAFPASFTSAGGGNNLGVMGATIDGTASGGGSAAHLSAYLQMLRSNQ